MHLDDSGGLDASSEDVLFGGLIVLGSKTIKVVQETVGRRHR